MTPYGQQTLRFLGAAGTETGSRDLVGRGRWRILIDCGLFPDGLRRRVAFELRRNVRVPGHLETIGLDAPK